VGWRIGIWIPADISSTERYTANLTYRLKKQTRSLIGSVDVDLIGACMYIYGQHNMIGFSNFIRLYGCHTVSRLIQNMSFRIKHHTGSCLSQVIDQLNL